MGAEPSSADTFPAVATTKRSPATATEEEILAAADAIARREGIDSLTIRGLCAELGVTAPVIYRRFENKEAIVTEVIDRVLARTTLPDTAHLDWVDCVAQCMLSTHDEVAPYPGLAFRMSLQFPYSPAGARNDAYMQGAMAAAGLSPSERAEARYPITAYLWGHLMIRGAVGLSDADDRELFLQGLDHILDGIRHRFGLPIPRRGENSR